MLLVYKYRRVAAACVSQRKCTFNAVWQLQYIPLCAVLVSTAESLCICIGTTTRLRNAS